MYFIAEKYNPEPGVEPEALVERTSALPTELFKSFFKVDIYILKWRWRWSEGTKSLRTKKTTKFQTKNNNIQL